ncbi:MAG: hypothetical protein JXQ82_05950 [Methanomicrobiaceae archaeon]|nr:hypothetical protein [Methanomicrobiaceae archaeon]
MKRTIAITLLLIGLVGISSGYVINFESPSSVESGSVLLISGTSTLPAGFTGEIVFYKKAQVGNNEVLRTPFTIQNGGLWSVNVDTTGWAAGEYTLNIPTNSEYSYGSSSTLLKAFTVTAAQTTVPTSPVMTQTEQQTQMQQTTVPTSSPAKTPSPTTAPVALWICPLGLLLSILLIRTGFVSKEN